MDDGARRAFPFNRFTAGKAEAVLAFSPAWRENVKRVGGQTGWKDISNPTPTPAPGRSARALSGCWKCARVSPVNAEGGRPDLASGRAVGLLTPCILPSGTRLSLRTISNGRAPLASVPFKTGRLVSPPLPYLHGICLCGP